MATRTTSQTGTWPGSGTALWGGDAVPTSADDVVINHAVTIDGAAVCAALAINAALTNGSSLTVTGNVTQANATFTMDAGSSLVFNATAADRKWLGGTGASQSSCKIVINGTSGSRCSISKTGSNLAWFDIGDENAGGYFNSFGWEVDYCDFTGISNSGGGVGIGISDFGAFHFRLAHSTFDACGSIFALRPYGWDGGATKDFYVRDCAWTNTVGTYPMYVRGTTAGSGVREIVRCYFDKVLNWNATADIEDVILEHGKSDGGNAPASTVGLLIQNGAGDGDQSLYGDSSDGYWIGNLNHVGNPHALNNLTADSTHTGWIAELPGGNNGLDSGELFYVGVGGVTITGCLLLPCAEDGKGFGNIAHNSSSGAVTAWTVEHNTAVGDDSTYIAYTEIGSDVTPRYASVKSNLVADLNNNGAAVAFDVFEAVTDLITPANADYNGKFGQLSYADSVSGQTLQGYRSHFTTVPGTNDIIADPQFVDPTRNFAQWAVFKGAASGGDSLATKIAASFTLLRADPSLLRTDLMPWIKAGFAPTNAVYQDAGHDSVTIGAVEYQSAANDYPTIFRMFAGATSGQKTWRLGT